jgi:hypothetical protein
LPSLLLPFVAFRRARKAMSEGGAK